MKLSMLTLTAIGGLNMARVPDQDIWNFFLDLFEGNEYAAAGACGNMMHESGCRTDNAENLWNEKTGHSDSWLTDRINNNLTGTTPVVTLSEFLQESWYVNNVGFGYGLSQWTTADRRTKLWNRTITQGIPIDDTTAQLNYIKWEFNEGGWQSVKSAMMACTSVQQAVDEYRLHYEGGSPSQSRLTYANNFYNTYAGQGGQYRIQINIDGNGEAEPSVGELVRWRADAGDFVTIWANPLGTDTFINWTVDYPTTLVLDRPATDATNSFTMPSSVVIVTAHFTGTSPTPPTPPEPPPYTYDKVKRKHLPIWQYPIFRA